MTLDELSTAWNKLRNKALGQGMKPNVPAVLAEVVAYEYGVWREYLQHAPAITEVAPSIAAMEFVKRYRELAAKVQKHVDLGPSLGLPTTPLEAVLKTGGSMARNFALGLGVAGVGLLTVVFINSRSRNGR